MFRILNVTTKLFSKGGQNPTWSKCGKVWTNAGALTSHLSQFSDAFLKKQPWEIQEFDFYSGTVSNSLIVMDFLASRPSRQDKEKQKNSQTAQEDMFSKVDLEALNKFIIAANKLTLSIGVGKQVKWIEVAEMARKVFKE